MPPKTNPQIEALELRISELVKDVKTLEEWREGVIGGLGPVEELESVRKGSDRGDMAFSVLKWGGMIVGGVILTAILGLIVYGPQKSSSRQIAPARATAPESAK